jgi:hypothetical protein
MRNAEQVRRVMAWVYDPYVTDRTLYSLQEEPERNGAGYGPILRRCRRESGEGRTLRTGGGTHAGTWIADQWEEILHSLPLS